MATFLYEAYDKSGAPVRGEFEAKNKDEVVAYLMKRGLTPASVNPLAGGGKLSLSFSFFERVTSVDVLFLIRNLATALKAGLSVVESLDILIADSTKGVIKRMLQGVMSTIKNGEPLSRSFIPYRDVFPVAFIGMLRAGEISGNLDQTLDSLSLYLRKEYSLRQRVKSALIYPIVLLLASIGVVVLLLVGVLPRLSGSFVQNDVNLPLLTKIFLAASNVLTYSLTLDMLIVAALIAGGITLHRTPGGRKFVATIFAHMPVAKDVVQKVALVRFTRTFGNLINGGISALEALDISADSVGNAVYAAALRDAAEEIKNGSPLSRALGRHPELFPNILRSLVSVGERTGSLGNILIALADFYDEEVENKLKDLTAIIEPALLLVMGLVVGAIALSILMPIYQLVGNFS